MIISHERNQYKQWLSLGHTPYLRYRFTYPNPTEHRTPNNLHTLAIGKRSELIGIGYSKWEQVHIFYNLACSLHMYLLN